MANEPESREKQLKGAVAEGNALLKQIPQDAGLHTENAKWRATLNEPYGLLGRCMNYFRLCEELGIEEDDQVRVFYSRMAQEYIEFLWTEIQCLVVHFQADGGGWLQERLQGLLEGQIRELKGSR